MVVLGGITFYLWYYKILIGILNIHTKYLKENCISDHFVYLPKAYRYLSDKANQLDRCLRHRGGKPDQVSEFHAGAYFV